MFSGNFSDHTHPGDLDSPLRLIIESKGSVPGLNSYN